jgi:predicted GTPase
VQLTDLAATIAAVPCDAVLLGTPHDLTHLLTIPHSVVRVTYEVTETAGSVMAALDGDVISACGDHVDLGSATELRGKLEAFFR